MELRKLSNGLKAAYRGSDVHRRVKHFDGWTERVEDAGPTGYDHTETVKEYYDLCSEFMVFGWGESLHFAPLSPRESLEDSKIRHQRLMIAKLELHKDMTVIDVGCGIGGPMRRVVREAGVRVVGVNSNEIQLEKAKSLNAEAGLDHMVDYLACSFMDMGTIADDTFDRGYAIESTCHAPDKAGAFAEIYRVLKPGALFWGQEMCMTDKFDPDDNRHRAINKDLMHGIALKDIATMGEVNRPSKRWDFRSSRQRIGPSRRTVRPRRGISPWRPGARRWTTPCGGFRWAARRSSRHLGWPRRWGCSRRDPRTSLGCWIVPPTPVSQPARLGSSRRCTVSSLSSPFRSQEPLKSLCLPYWRYTMR